MADTPTTPTIRIVPGAPPPSAMSKSQKKKKAKGAKKTPEHEHVALPDSTSAALTEKAPTEVDVKEGSVAPELVVQPEGQAPQTPVEDPALKATPIVDMLNKRLKQLQKKILRIEQYSSLSPEKLNDDQRRLLPTLPSLEATRKELEEVKKAIITHEAEVAQEQAVKHAEAARAERARLAEAVAAAEAEYRRKTADLIHFLRLRDLLSQGHPTVTKLGIAEPEGTAIHHVTEKLFSNELEERLEIINSFVAGQGEVQGVSYSRLVEITQLFLHPPAVEEPAVEETVVEESFEVVEAPIATPPTVAGAAFHFMQEDELAQPQPEPELVPNPEDAQEEVAEVPTTVEVVETVVETEVIDHAVVEETITVTATTEVPEAAALNGAINWADEDEHGLPSIGSLHAQFGTSGDATPAPEAPAEPDAPLSPAPQHTHSHPHANGHAPHPEEDGFKPMRGRGRGSRGGFRGEHGGYRGRGAFRGAERGSFRGGERGGFRGGERGGFRGGEREGSQGGEREGFRGGERGGFRGGERERGGYRGKPQGEWRGDSDGEYRGRGRGRGRVRSGFRDARGGPPAPAPAA